MSGWSPTRAPPRPAELGLRLLLAGALVLGTLHALQRAIIEPLVPVFAAAVRVLDPDFTILSAGVASDGPVQSVVIRANLALPARFAGRTVYPIGWFPGEPEGGIEVKLSLGGLLQYSGLLLIIALAWPARTAAEFALRLLLCLPCLALLLLAEAPFTVLGELWSAIRDYAAPGSFCGWVVWSRFLMGGGGLLIAGSCGLSVVAASRRIVRTAARP
ncbi:MAG TPA: hypothetical protein VMB48_05165 [Steroidobacteraceae bacterium]|nr:hypothetical protein [Steroidobacteraceae bacterium]